MVHQVKSQTRLPLAVKLSPFHTSLPSFAERLMHAGAQGLVLFNRFYQPDIDIDRLEVTHQLSLRLRWLAILSGSLEVSLEVSGGIHSGVDALKAVAAGACGVQVVSEILKHGPSRFAEIRRTMSEWLGTRKYDSLAQLHRRMNLARCPNPADYERVNYLHMLSSWPRRRA